MTRAVKSTRGGAAHETVQGLRIVGPVSEARQGSFIPRHVMSLLLRHAGPSLTPAELLAIAGGSAEAAAELAGGTADLVDAVGCLVDADGRGSPSMRAGNYQSGQDVPGLLSFIATQLRQVEGPAALSGDAAAMVKDRGTAA